MSEVDDADTKTKGADTVRSVGHHVVTKYLFH